MTKAGDCSVQVGGDVMIGRPAPGQRELPDGDLQAVIVALDAHAQIGVAAPGAVSLPRPDGPAQHDNGELPLEPPMSLPLAIGCAPWVFANRTTSRWCGTLVRDGEQGANGWIRQTQGNCVYPKKDPRSSNKLTGRIRVGRIKRQDVDPADGVAEV